MSLLETDVHPKGKLQSFVLMLVFLFSISALVEIMLPFPWVFGVGLTIITFFLTILGGVNAKYAGITFGSLLLLTYTMLGFQTSYPWYFQPLLMVCGASLYGLLSLLIALAHPKRVLKEQVSTGFETLAAYISLKSKLFSEPQEKHEEIRIRLAVLNIEVTNSINQIKRELNEYNFQAGQSAGLALTSYYQQWYLLQEMQRRITSSHTDFVLLAENSGSSLVIQGIAQFLDEIGQTVNKYAQSILTGITFKLPVNLKWTMEAINSLYHEHKQEVYTPSLALLLKNINATEKRLHYLEQLPETPLGRMPKASKPKYSSLRELLKSSHPRFRFAIRLSACLLAGFVLLSYFQIEQGAWILMTSLIVCQQTYSATRQRFFHRVSGTLLGVVAGVLLVKMIPTMSGQIVLLLLCIFGFYYFIKSNYTLAAGFITIFVMASFNIQFGTGMALMGPRILDTLLGGILAYGAVYFLWPDWQYKQIPLLMKEALQKNRLYFEGIYKKGIDYDEFLQIQSDANNTDKNLTAAWNGMRYEPKQNQQFLEYAYSPTYYNHSLLSYISAFAIHNFGKELTPDEKSICNEISFLLEHSQTNDRSKFREISNQSKQVLKELLEKQEKYPDHAYSLIYNIARVTDDLIWEQKRQLKNEEKKQNSTVDSF